VRALLTLDKDDPSRVAQLRLDVSDLRGWKPKPIRCWDGAHVSVYPPSGDRFAKGTWTFDAGVATFTCTVPDDILDVGTCTPAGDKPPGAEQASMATGIKLHLPGQPAKIVLAIAHDGAPVAQKQLTPAYRTGPAANTETGTCTTALETVTLRAP
jgi:hypothetical protein